MAEIFLKSTGIEFHDLPLNDFENDLRYSPYIAAHTQLMGLGVDRAVRKVLADKGDLKNPILEIFTGATKRTSHQVFGLDSQINKMGPGMIIRWDDIKRGASEVSKGVRIDTRGEKVAIRYLISSNRPENWLELPIEERNRIEGDSEHPIQLGGWSHPFVDEKVQQFGEVDVLAHWITYAMERSHHYFDDRSNGAPDRGCAVFTYVPDDQDTNKFNLEFSYP